MATRTSTQSGNWADSSTWGGSAAPIDGDKAVIATGHTVTVAANAAVGANGSSIGHAVQVQATDATTFGKLIVAAGMKLVLKGNDTTNNQAMRIDRYAQVENLGTIHVDCASDFQSIIDCRGILSGNGTFSTPAANYTWGTAVAGEAFSGTGWKFDLSRNLASGSLANPWISNAGGTALGSAADSSVSFSALTPATILQTEVATRELVTSAGKYFIDYDTGFLLFYHVPADGNPAYTKAYKRLTSEKGWGIVAQQNTTYNEVKLDGATLEYMGQAADADTRALDVQFKQAASVAANRLFYLKNSTVRYCHRPLGIKDLTGASGDEVLITGNTFGACRGGIYGGCITQWRETSTYVKIDSNTFREWVYPVLPVIRCATYATVRTLTGWKVTNNTLYGNDFLHGQHDVVVFPGLDCSGNTIIGSGSGSDSRLFLCVGGTSGSQAVVSSNLIQNVTRTFHYTSYVTFEKNRTLFSMHHGFVGGVTGDNDFFITKLRVWNNKFFGEAASAYDGSPSVELGYNQRMWLDDVEIFNNTFEGNHAGIVGFGDMQDVNTFTLSTRVKVANNGGRMVTSAGSTAWSRPTTHATFILSRLHVQFFDNNGDYNYGTRYLNFNRQGTFVKGGQPYNDDALVTRTVDGVALFDPNFATATNKGLAFVYTSATNQTLAYDGGTAIQLVIAPGGTSTGACTGAAAGGDGDGGVRNGTLTDTLAAFSTDMTAAGCPRACWVKITSGAGAGQIRAITNNTDTVLTVAPAWTTVPTAADTYVIIKSEVTLDDGADTVKAGIYLPDLPTSSQSDTGIDFADHSVTASDPLLLDPVGLDALDYKFTSASPWKNAGSAVYYASPDYFGRARSTPDIGFYEYAADTYNFVVRATNAGGTADANVQIIVDPA